ncbi:Polypeptide N-acetylgalactosaminyltransferase-like 6 [Symbiodinium microadriaticum]|uniref:Polypeptide N-acetylgalactosaminyltransferase-like 6 n=1 Tax=Symbiodinium microadriaticum TaxID=2951 RepID=A0A1Q9CE68_SYMMI|nr:Polypeptide N-acetylgalactosaminyltransferase-like 6 [Symbiodinium microadriaticum]
MTTQDELELQRARQELSQFEAYNPSSKILQSPPSTAAPSQTGCTKAMDTNETDKRAPDSELDPATTPQPKYAKAAGKGEGAEQDKGLPRPSATARPEYASPRSQTLLGQSFKRNSPDWSFGKRTRSPTFKMDLGFMVFLKTNMQPRLPQEEGQTSTTQWAIVKNLYEAATSWHNNKDAEPQNLNATLRTTLMYCMISMLCSRVEILETDEGEESLLKLEQLGLIEDGKFLYLRWNADLRRHEKADRSWFLHLGGYDPELRIYGGEEMELGFSAWQCGGSVVHEPKWQTFPDSSQG